MRIIIRRKDGEEGSPSSISSCDQPVRRLKRQKTQLGHRSQAQQEHRRQQQQQRARQRPQRKLQLRQRIHHSVAAFLSWTVSFTHASLPQSLLLSISFPSPSSVSSCIFTSTPHHNHHRHCRHHQCCLRRRCCCCFSAFPSPRRKQDLLTSLMIAIYFLSLFRTSRASGVNQGGCADWASDASLENVTCLESNLLYQQMSVGAGRLHKRSTRTRREEPY